MYEASETPRDEWTVRGEHNNDARRAYQIAALAIATDRELYAPLAALVGMDESDRRKARDYGAEVHRSWRRMLTPLWMPKGLPSTETSMRRDEGNPTCTQLYETLGKDLHAILRRFDWHSTVTIAFVEGDGGAGWSRGKRTATVNSAYVQRFVKQGAILDLTRE